MVSHSRQNFLDPGFSILHVGHFIFGLSFEEDPSGNCKRLVGNLIKPPYDIPEELLNIVLHFMIFSKSRNRISCNLLILHVFISWHETRLLIKQMQNSKRTRDEMG